MQALLIEMKAKQNASEAEMVSLLKAMHVEKVTTIRFTEHSETAGSIFGKGQWEEILQYCQQDTYDVVVVNRNLTPLQYRNMQEELNIDVYDRTMVILQIFHQQAHAKEARLQVEIAMYRYLSSRLVQKDAAYDQSSGKGINRGSGEKKITEQRFFHRRRMSELEEELAVLVKERKIQRRNRGKANEKVVAIVGYTNAGKSTLCNVLIRQSIGSKKEVEAEDQLFKTLSTSTRRIHCKGYPSFLITDTVGFIENLPPQLIASFRSTLEEVKDADVILHVIDASDPLHEEHRQVSEAVLKQLGVEQPMIYVYSKRDQCKETFVPPVTPAIVTSFLEEDPSFLKFLALHIFDDYCSCQLFLPFDQGKLYAKLKEQAIIEKEEQKENGYQITALMSKQMLKNMQPFLTLQTVLVQSKNFFS